MKILTTLLALAMLTTATLSAADGPIRHVVHFKFKADADKAQVAKVVEEFAALKAKIPVVEALEYGTNVSPEGHDKGFTHCWIATFKNAADRDAYLVHPAHKAFVTLLGPVLDDALVIDFVVQK
jgi:Stress responsive A/B Barrel Domain